MKIVKYQTLVAPTAQGLDRIVEEAIAKGWQPLGGVSYYTRQTVSPSPRVEQGFIQAMVRYEELTYA